MTFESTLPLGEPDLMRVSAFQRYLAEIAPAGADASLTTLSTLSPSLMQDLVRFERGGRQTELLEVVAACVRHSVSLLVHLQYEEKVLPLTLFPLQRVVHCSMPLDDLLALRLSELQVMHAEPAVLRPPGDHERRYIGESHLYRPLAPLTWELAMRGSREELLPEIAGSAAYRVAPGFDLHEVPLTGAVRAAVRRLQVETTNLRSIADWPGFNRARAMRLLNALYLQAGLIVSRSHPAALSDTWFGAT